MKYLVVLVFMCVVAESFGQQYNSAVGIRGGLLNSITYKKTLNDFSAGEGIASFWQNGVVLTGLYTIQNPWNVEGEQLEWYYGGGAHIGFFDNRRASFFEDSNNSSAVIGIDGVIGAEYTFPDIPLNISLDYKPALNLIGYSGFWLNHISLGVRYVID